MSLRFAVPALLAAVGLLVAGCPDQPLPPDPSATPTTTATSEAPARQALYFYPPAQGATLKYTNSGATGASTSDVTVDSVATNGGTETVTVTEVTSGSGETVTVTRVFRTDADGGLTIDAEGFLAAAPGLTVTAVGDDIAIPSITALEAGQTGSGETFVEFSGAGLSGRNDVTYTVAGEGFSSVTVPAGKVDAYVVELTLNIDSSFAGATTGTARYWFVPGFGLVRQETEIVLATAVAELTQTSVSFS